MNLYKEATCNFPEGDLFGEYCSLLRFDFECYSSTQLFCIKCIEINSKMVRSNAHRSDCKGKSKRARTMFAEKIHGENLKII